MRTFLLVLLSSVTVMGQVRTIPQQGPPPKNLVRQPDGHFTANQEPSNPEKFEVHVVQRGETLSQIAGEVLKNSRLWPQLWEQNEHIVNPHWIYPNDKILIRPVTLITEAGPIQPPPSEPPAPEPPPPPPAPPAPAPRPVQTPPPAPPPAPQQVISVPEPKPVPELKADDVYCSGFVQEAKVSKDLRVIGTFDNTNSVFAVELNYLYIGQGSQAGVTTGTVYDVVRPTMKITNPEGRTSRERDLGMHYLNVGQVQVVMTQPDYALGRVVRSCGDAIEVGDLMIPFQSPPIPVLPRPRTFSPTMAVAGDVKGDVVMTKGALLNFGSVYKGSGKVPGVRGGDLGGLERGIATEGGIVYVDIGQNQGVKPGDLFIVYRWVKQDTRLYHLPKESEKLRNVRTAIGELVVVKTGERASSALVTYATDGISLGDFVERR